MCLSGPPGGPLIPQMPSTVFLTVAYSLSAAISVSAAFAVFRRREVRGGRPLGMMLLAAALWAACEAIELHLPTVEAVRAYLSHLKHDGVLILHLSNRNLELRAPAMAVAKAAGGYALLQRHPKDYQSPNMWESSEDALIIGRSAAALAPFEADDRWEKSDPTQTRPWTDDYTNLVGALIGRVKERLAE